jgi:hypothetical protein
MVGTTLVLLLFFLLLLQFLKTLKKLDNCMWQFPDESLIVLLIKLLLRLSNFGMSRLKFMVRYWWIRFAQTHSYAVIGVFKMVI